MTTIVPAVLLATSLAAGACTPVAVHRTTYEMRYAVVPRKVLVNAMDAARALHYSVVAVEAPDVFHNRLLAFADSSSSRAPTALLVDVSQTEGRCSTTNQLVKTCTHVEVLPISIRDGRAVPAAEVPAQTRVDAELLVDAIYERTRPERDWMQF